MIKTNAIQILEKTRVENNILKGENRCDKPEKQGKYYSLNQKHAREHGFRFVHENER